MKVCTKFHGNQSVSFWDILVQTKVVQRPTDIAIPRAIMADKEATTDKWKKEG